MIGSLIDKPLCWTVDELEKTTFHQKTTRLQYLRKKNRGSDYGVHVNPTAVNPLPAGNKMFFNVNLPLNEVIKTIVAEGMVFFLALKPNNGVTIVTFVQIMSPQTVSFLEYSKSIMLRNFQTKFPLSSY